MEEIVTEAAEIRRKNESEYKQQIEEMKKEVDLAKRYADEYDDRLRKEGKKLVILPGGNIGIIGGRMHVLGEIKNLTDKPINGLCVQAGFFTVDNLIIGTKKSRIDIDPLLSGQSSQFKLEIKYDPRVVKVLLRFTNSEGEILPHAHYILPKK